MRLHEILIGFAVLAVVIVVLRVQYNHVTAKVTDTTGAGYTFPVSTPVVSPLCARPSDCKSPTFGATPTSRGLVVP
jgi:hypothetical protein